MTKLLFKKKLTKILLLVCFVVLARHLSTKLWPQRHVYNEDYMQERLGYLPATEDDNYNEPSGNSAKVSRFPLNALGRYKAKVVGKVRNTLGYLTIGIPTVSRRRHGNKSYLNKTLTSLLEQTSEEDQKDIVIVIFVTDFNRNFTEDLVAKLGRIYGKYINSGFIQIVTIAQKYYPTLDNITSSMKQNAKQTLDYSFLWHYSAPFSKYYLQLEDDLITAPGYVGAIRNCIHFYSNITWIDIEFSEQGKLYKSADLEHLASMAILFHDQISILNILAYWKSIMLQQVSFKFPKHMGPISLWKHIGAG